MKKKVLIPTKLDKKASSILVSSGNYDVVQEDKTPLADLAARNADAFAIIVRSEKVTPAVMDALPKLKVVVRAGAGYDNIDTKYARSKGVDVMNTPGANANAVAEEVIALMLADARSIIAADASTRAGKWEKNKFMGREITAKTVGIVGLGSIGQLVARRLAGFEPRILGYDPVISTDKASELGVELVDLKTLFDQSDYITLHLPENNETRGMVCESLLASMKEGATLVNCARAGIVNEDSLRKVKAERKLRFLNDVYPADAEGVKSVTDIADIMMPHLGASTHEANFNAAKRAAEEIIEYCEKGITSFVVNRDIPQGLDREYCDLANTIARLCRCMLGTDTKLKLIETSIYGALKPYADWLIVPVVAGIWPDFDISLDFQAARDYLKQMGIEYVNRDTDPGKRFGGSITVDITGEIGGGNMRKLSIRGTVAESRIMISRINDFDKLYFEPHGHTVFFIYDDRPGVIGSIGAGLAKAGVNIEDMRNPHDIKTNRSLALAKVNCRVSQQVMDTIATKIKAMSFFQAEI